MMEEKLRVLRTDEDIAQLLTYLSNPELGYVAFDTETTGLSLDAQVIGFSVCAEINLGFYVVLAEWRGGDGLVWLDNRSRATEVLELLLTKSLVMHNAVVDINWTKVNFGVDLMPALHTDTMLLAHLVDENRRVGLKELAYTIFGETAKKEQEEMQASVIANGGVWENARGGSREMYKADPDLMARYGAKDTILTLRLFYYLLPQLFEEGLDTFFYDEETMPLLKCATYDMNTTGLKLDLQAMRKLQTDLELSIGSLQEQIQSEIRPYVSETFPKGFGKGAKQFNLNSKQHMAWLLYMRLRNEWKKLTKGGRKLAKELLGKSPYSPKERKAFEVAVTDTVPSKNLPSICKFIQCDKNAFLNLSHRYSWVAKLLKHNQDTKLLTTYVKGLQQRERYGIIHPSFLQHGTTSGRYSSRDPNFQNLPRDDTRIKKCIVARPGYVFVGADFSQLEARVFAFMSGDESLIASFSKGEDFYSLIGMNIFQKFDCTPHKEGSPDAFGVKYKALRQIAKNVALAATYGTTAFRLTDMLRDDQGDSIPPSKCQVIIDDFFAAYPKIRAFQQSLHKQVIETGLVTNYFGRKRRIPNARRIKRLLNAGDDALDLPYEYRTLLNLAVNHTIQSTAASLVNRAAIAFRQRADQAGLPSPIVLQVHDELVIETTENFGRQVSSLLKECMENTTKLAGMKLPAEPKIARNLANLK